MKTYKFLSAFGAAAVLLGLAACADTDAQYDVKPMDAPEFVSESPSVQAPMLLGERTIELNFNEKINFITDNTSKIMFDGKPVKKALVLGASNVLTITVDADLADTHTLHVPAGLVTTADKQAYDKDIDLTWTLPSLPSNVATQRGVLPAVRPDCPQPVCTHRAFYQLGHGGVRRAGRHLYDDPQKGGADMKSYLKTENLAVGYHGKPLIEEVSLCVQRGKIVTLIGPNGSGKSTILKTVIGQLPELSGAVYLDGETMRSRSRSDIARRMAILMTVRVEPELMTCRDVVSSGRYPYTGKLGVLREEDRKIVEQSLAQADALSFADSPFSAISDGQRQRILLARALCQQPQLIVLDEPTSYLDIRYKLELLSVLKRMVRENDLAVLLSLHELDLARRISDTIVCVAGDRIDRIGPPEEIFTSDYIAQLYHLERGKYDPCFSTLEFVP